MFASAELPKHRSGVIFIVRFSQHESIAFCHRVGCHHNGGERARPSPASAFRIIVEQFHNRGGLAKGQLGNQPGGTRLAANTALDLGRRRHHGEFITGLGQ